MTRQELKDYFSWFVDRIPVRLFELSRAVNESQGYETWQPNLEPSSLDGLGNWFAEQVEVRPKTMEEVREFEAKRAFPVEVPNYELTDRTFSIAIDIGMYVSQVFIKHHPSLRWYQSFGNKKFVDYGQPVLVEFQTAPFNPVRMMVTLAYGVADHSRSKSLADIYNIWSRLIRA